MLLPRTHAWTPAQRWLIIALVASALVSVGALVYSYERYHRGPSETVLYGTWQVPLEGVDDVYLQFNPDWTFSVLSLFEGEATPFLKGRWYAGGSNIYLRYTEGSEELEARRPVIWHIVDIEPNELSIRMWRNDVRRYKRVNLASSPRI